MENNNKVKLSPSDSLSIIQCSRLLCNTNRELGMLVDYPAIASGNSLSRMGGKSQFIKGAVLGGLAAVVRERTGLDLQVVLDAYVEADRLYAAIPKRYRNEQTCRDLINHCCAAGELTPAIATVAVHVDDSTLPLLVLLLLGVLPRVASRDGDVADIQGAYDRLLALLRSVVGDGRVLVTLPVIKHVENEWNSNPGNHNRLFLVKMADMVLSGYGSVASPWAMGLSNREMQEGQFFPDVDGIWVEDECSTVFWRFETVANGHHLYRYSIKGDQRQLHYVKYFVKFFHLVHGHDIALVIHPRSIRYLVEGKPLPNALVAYMDCVIGDGAISLAPLPESDDWFALRKLVRPATAAPHEQLLHDGRWTQCNEFSDDDYRFNLALAAITTRHLYVGTTADGQYYRVPKSLNVALEQVDFNHSVGVLAMGDGEKVYVAFDEHLLYYDVSTPDKMNRLGIELVESISE